MQVQLDDYTLHSKVIRNGTHIFWLENRLGDIVADRWLNYKPGEQELSSLVLELQKEAEKVHSNPFLARTKSERVRELIHEGKPVSQASAIAYKEYGKNPMTKQAKHREELEDSLDKVLDMFDVSDILESLSYAVMRKSRQSHITQRDKHRLSKASVKIMAVADEVAKHSM